MFPQSITDKAAKFKEHVDIRFFAGRPSHMDLRWPSLGWCSQFVFCFRSQFSNPENRTIRDGLIAYMGAALFAALEALYSDCKVIVESEDPLTLQIVKSDDTLLYEIPIQILLDKILSIEWSRSAFFHSATPMGLYPLQTLFFDLLLCRLVGVGGKWSNSSPEELDYRLQRAVPLLAADLSASQEEHSVSVSEAKEICPLIARAILGDSSIPGEVRLLEGILRLDKTGNLLRTFAPLFAVPCETLQIAVLSYALSFEKRPPTARARLLAQATPLHAKQQRLLLHHCRKVCGFVEDQSLEGWLWEVGLERELGFQDTLILPQQALASGAFQPFVELLREERFEEALSELRVIPDENPWLLLQGGYILKRLGDSQGALETAKHIESSMGSAPGDAKAKYCQLLGELYAQEGDWESSGRMMEMALKHGAAEEHPAVCAGLITALNKMGKYTMAFQLSSQWVAAISFSLEFILQAIVAACGAGNSQAAWQWMKQVEKVLPTDRRVLMTRLVLFEVGAQEFISTQLSKTDLDSN